MGEKTTDGGGTPEKKLYFPLVSPERAKDNLPPFQGSYNDGVPVSCRGLHPRLCSGCPFGTIFCAGGVVC